MTDQTPEYTNPTDARQGRRVVGMPTALLAGVGIAIVCAVVWATAQAGFF
jgi:hypothetical protein